MKDKPMTSAQIVLPEGEYAQYLADYAARKADEKAARREHVYRAILGLVVAALAVLGFSSVSTLKSDITAVVSAGVMETIADRVDNELDDRKNDIVQTTMDQIQADVDAKLAFIQLTLLATKMADGDSFPTSERDAAVSLLREAATSAEIKASPEFKATLEKVIATFFAADLDEDIDQVERALAGVTVDTDGIVLTLVAHYGMRVVGDAELKPETETTFRKYARAARRHNAPELALVYEIALAFRKAGNARTELADRLFEDAGQLEPERVDRFVSLMRVNTRADDGPDANGKLHRVGRLFTALNEAYTAELQGLEESVGSRVGPEDELEKKLMRLLEEAVSEGER